MFTTDNVLFEKIPGKSGFLGVITLNRPTALNALTHAMTQSIIHYLDVWMIDEDIKAVLIQSNSEKAFCAGGDLAHIYHTKQQVFLVNDFFRDEYKLNQKIHQYSKPYIAFLNGITMGGGVGISIHGSHRVATENLLIAMPETGIGFFPDAGASYFFSRCKQQLGVYLGLLGTRLKIADAIGVGLIDYHIPSDKLEQVKQAILQTPLDFGDKVVVSDILQSYAVPISPGDLLNHADTIEEIFSAVEVEAIFENLLSRSDQFSQATLNTLKLKSPTSLKVTRKQLQLGVNKSIDQCMKMEYQLAKHFLQSQDFFEGIRAVIIDKDQSPRWHPEKLEDVSKQMVDDFFGISLG